MQVIVLDKINQYEESNIGIGDYYKRFDRL